MQRPSSGIGVILQYLSLCCVLHIYFFLSINKYLSVLLIIFIASACLLIVYSPHISYRYIMWLPWSLMLYFTLFYVRYEKRKNLLLLTFCVSLIVFLVSYVTQSSLHHSLILINNKYPPNI